MRTIKELKKNIERLHIKLFRKGLTDKENIKFVELQTQFSTLQQTHKEELEFLHELENRRKLGFLGDKEYVKKVQERIRKLVKDK